jgi:hypothetical protein
MRKLVCLAVFLLTLIIATSLPVPAQSKNTDEVISKARAAYYNLKRQGFAGFKAAVIPNWEVILGPTATQENLKIFRAVRFSIAQDAEGALSVNHEVSKTDEARVEPYLKAIHDNIQRLVTGFLGMWARFMVNSPFPEDETQIKIEKSGSGYRLFYTTNTSDVSLAMTNNLQLTEWKFSAPLGSRTIKPRFQETVEGLLLSGYQSTFEPVGPGIHTTLDFTIEYQEVERFRLPMKVGIRGVHNQQPVEAELRFAHYVLNVRRVNY